MKQPYRLNEGIFFEDTEKMLFWGSKFEQLMLIDNPEISQDGDVLKWFGKSCFGNNKLNVTIYKDDYQNQNNTLDCANFECENETQETIYSTAKKYSDLFKDLMGKPNESKSNYGRLTEVWNIDELQIIVGIGERFTEFLVFGIRKGKRFWKLA